MAPTVKQRLTISSAIGVLAVLAVGGVAVVTSEQQTAAAERMARISAGMSQQWNADMMHDGIRGDVLGALYAGSAQQRTELEVDDVTAKGTEMLERLDGAAASAPADLRPDFEQARTEVVAYTGQANAIVATAATDRAAAERLLPAFLESFTTLEEQLGAIDEAMLAAVQEGEAAAGRSGARALVLVLLIGALGLAGVVVASTLVALRILESVSRTTAALSRVAARDLTVRLPEEGTDEFSRMGAALNSALAEITATIAEAGRAADALSRECSTLDATAGDLGDSVDRSSQRARTAARSAGEVAEHVRAMSEATRQMNGAITEIAGQTTSAAEVAADAARSASTTSETVTQLNQASEEIGEIVKAITSIAEQTNLLALNATIEAARAGEAGKGFAVVANEVKDLAQETGRATSDITAKIAAIQSITGRAAESIRSITDVIGRIHDSTQTIASAVEEQSATTAMMNRSVEDVARGASAIVSDVEGITAAAETTSGSAGTTRTSAATLSSVATEVSTQISRFRIGV